MDEYTLILVAKLKADRARLEREQRAVLRWEGMPSEGPVVRDRHPARTRALSREDELRELS